VQLVIADTGPVNYLIPIGHIDILPALFQKVILPAVVRDELEHQKAPAAVQQWIANLPALGRGTLYPSGPRSRHGKTRCG
jgi:predicted nucleic acid-binding protein